MQTPKLEFPSHPTEPSHTMSNQDRFGNDIPQVPAPVPTGEIHEKARSDALEEYEGAKRIDRLRALLKELRGNGQLSEEDIVKAMMEASLQLG